MRAPVATTMSPATTSADQRAERHPPVAPAGQGPVGEVLGQPAQHQHEHDQGDRLDQHLGQREVGRAVQEEQHRGAVAGDPDHDRPP